MLLELRCPSVLECSFACDKTVKSDMHFNAVHMNIIKHANYSPQCLKVHFLMVYGFC